jgi:GH35 family endo-1,4-beta-xylanase
MLRFRVFKEGVSPADFDLSTAYLVGSDSVPIRGEFSYFEGEIFCRKRAAGPAALNVLWETKNFGSVMLETTRLPERDEPYNLNLELARGRVMRLMQKREEWGLFDILEAGTVNEKAIDARDLLLEAITHQEDGAKASGFADKCLQMVLPLSEQAALTHADLLLQRRIATRNFPRGAFGVRVDPAMATEQYRRLLLPTVDFVRMPMWWKTIEPAEQQFAWQQIDEWMDFLRRARVPVVAGPLVHFSNVSIPDWLYIWEHDYETVRDLLYEHVDRVAQRYGPHVVLWNVLSGLHVNAQFSFTFDQLMDLTRMTVGLIKKTNQNARTMIELTQPWGEYYATNQRSIPPLLYAEMIVQSGIQFDVFGVQLRFGIPRDGCWQRDLFQISSLLDRFAPLGKPLMISALQVPSYPTDPTGGTGAGIWRKPWSEALQAKWLEAVTDIALSKPYVEAICWNDLSDPKAPIPSHQVPFGGLANHDNSPKQAAKTWGSLRRAVAGFRQGQPKPGGAGGAGAASPTTPGAPPAGPAKPG